VSGCVDLLIEADSVVISEATNDARLKKVRKAEAMETATAEPLAFPETKMRRVDCTPLVESGAEITVSPAGLESGDMKSCARRSDEARMRKNAKHRQRQRARKAIINISKNKTEADGAQETEATDGSSKWETSSENSHGLN
jgi:hypothetical protein